MEKAAFYSNCCRHLLWILVAFPAHHASTKTIIHGLTECLIHYPSIPHSITSNQGTQLKQKKNGNGPIPMESLVLPCSPLHSNIWLTEVWDSLLKTHL